MAQIALQAASTGLSALSTQLDIIANNLANSNTDGFKASRANFQNLLYVEIFVVLCAWEDWRTEAKKYMGERTLVLFNEAIERRSAPRNAPD